MCFPFLTQQGLCVQFLPNNPNIWVPSELAVVHCLLRMGLHFSGSSFASWTLLLLWCWALEFSSVALEFWSASGCQHHNGQDSDHTVAYYTSVMVPGSVRTPRWVEAHTSRASSYLFFLRFFAQTLVILVPSRILTPFLIPVARDRGLATQNCLRLSCLQERELPRNRKRSPYRLLAQLPVSLYNLPALFSVQSPPVVMLCILSSDYSWSFWQQMSQKLSFSPHWINCLLPSVALPSVLSWL
jgi:hypothetical protein